MEASAPGVLVELDDRRRASLGRVGRHNRYLARVERDGTIVLTPAVVMSAADFEALARPAAKTTQTADLDPTPAPNTVGDRILAAIKAAGKEGIRARDLVEAIPAARSRIFNELALLRNAKKVSNPTGKYVLGG